MKHKNSKEITIFRAGSFLSRVQGKEVDDFFASSSKTVGSYWESKNSKRVGTGLTEGEKRLLLPLIIEVGMEHPEFNKQVNNFFHEIATPIPYSTGMVLEIGLEFSNDKPLSKDNLPIKVMDYIRYKHAVGHPFTALNKEEADGNSLMHFYLFDKSELASKSMEHINSKDTAMKQYLELKDDKVKVDIMLTLLGLDPREYEAIEKDAPSLKAEALRNLAETKATKFSTVFDMGDLTERYWVQTMVNTGVVRMVGNKYVINETNKLIANSLDEAIFFFKDGEANSDVIVMLKEKMQECLKNKKAKK